jgi:nucleoid-associated protein YgaU
MTERTSHAAGAIACPFLALVDDREERSDTPDHRHRCYAEIRPAQRALAHQQAFCLSAGFTGCPTFQDWARREAAHTRGSPLNARVDEEVIAPVDGPAAEAADEELSETGALPDDEEPEDEAFDDRAMRNPPREWSAPPPWAEPGSTGAAGAAASAGAAEVEAPPFLEPRPSSGEPEEPASPAGLSASRWLQDVPPPRSDEAAAGRSDDDELERALAEDRANRERAAAAAVAGVSATASSSRAARKAIPPAAPQTVSSSRRRPVTHDVAGPAWERPRRYEAYPTLRTRIGMPAIPRVGLAALAIVVAAIVLFSLPFVLHLGSDQGGAVASPSPSAAASGSVAPSVAASPTAKVYIVKSGDTLLKIAKKFGITIDQLLAANKQIKNPNKIQPGDEITIPVVAPSGVGGGASAGPSAAP